MDKRSVLYLIFILSALTISCRNPAKNTRLQGKWISADQKISLQITPKEFILDEGETPIAENYFVKGDTIFTSYEGAEPFTPFVYKNLTEKSLTLIYPDSTSVILLKH